MTVFGKQSISTSTFAPTKYGAEYRSLFPFNTTRCVADLNIPLVHNCSVSAIFTMSASFLYSTSIHSPSCKICSPGLESVSRIVNYQQYAFGIKTFFKLNRSRYGYIPSHSPCGFQLQAIPQRDRSFVADNAVNRALPVLRPVIRQNNLRIN